MNTQSRHPTTSQRTLERLEKRTTLVMLSSIISITSFVSLDVTFAPNPDNYCSTLGCQRYTKDPTKLSPTNKVSWNNRAILGIALPSHRYGVLARPANGASLFHL